MTEDNFRKIYHQYYKVVRKVVYSVLHDADFAEDVCQEVFIMFSEKADVLDKDFYRQWFLVNAKRKAIDFCRKSYQVHEVTSMPSDEGEYAEQEGILWTSCSGSTRSIEDEITHKLLLRELTGKLFEDLAKKNSDWYEIVMRMIVEGENAEETAYALGISIGNLRAKRYRIKQWIMKHYKNKFDEI